MNNPKVTVILSSYNHAEFISRSIESILNQSFKDFKLLIIDDASTDDSWKVIKNYKDHRIIAIKNKKNLGIAIRPEIIEKARGEYIAIAHCDDEWNKDKLKKQVKFLDKNPDYAACFTLVQPIDENNKPFADKTHFYYSAFDQKNRSRLEWLRRFFYEGNCLCHPSVLLRKQAQQDYDLYAQGCAAIPDEYRWIKICLHENIYILQEKLTSFRVRKNEGNTSGDRLENRLRLNFERYAVLDAYLETLNYSEADFKTIFPTSEKYFNTNGKNNLKYILSRVLIEQESNRPHQLYGLKLLWDMFRSHSEQEEIERLYNFTHKDFVTLSGSIDVFKLLSDDNVLTSSLYYDTGNGFNDDELIRKEIFINNQRKFIVEYDLSELPKIQKIRFDPTHGAYYCLRSLKVTCNNKEIPFKPFCASINKAGDISFNTNNPQIALCEGIKNKKLVITGEAIKRDLNQIDKDIKKAHPIRCIKNKLINR